MNIEQYLAAFLAKNHSISIQDIGVIYFSGQPLTNRDEESNSVEFPENSIRFEFDKKATADEAFIQYLVTQTGKIKPLVASDLESYSIICKQFLNIGKPLLLKDIGVLQKNQQGIYDFTQGSSIIETIDTTSKVAIDKASQSQEINFSSVSKKKNNHNQINNKKGLVIILVLLAGIISVLIFQNQFNKTSSQLGGVDTIAVSKTIIIPDTFYKNINDSFRFKIILGKYKDSSKADSARISFLQKNTQAFIIKDSSSYLLAVGFMNAFSDTIAIKDSMKKLLGYDAILKK